MNKRITPGAMGYIIINVVVFVAMFLRDPSLSSQTMIDFGAKTNFQIADGKLWYLMTPMFLHGSILHLFFNSMAIYFFGPYVELFRHEEIYPDQPPDRHIFFPGKLYLFRRHLLRGIRRHLRISGFPHLSSSAK